MTQEKLLFSRIEALVLQDVTDRECLYPLDELASHGVSHETLDQHCLHCRVRVEQILALSLVIALAEQFTQQDSAAFPGPNEDLPGPPHEESKGLFLKGLPFVGVESGVWIEQAAPFEQFGQ